MNQVLHGACLLLSGCSVLLPPPGLCSLDHSECFGGGPEQRRE